MHHAAEFGAELKLLWTHRGGALVPSGIGRRELCSMLGRALKSDFGRFWANLRFWSKDVKDIKGTQDVFNHRAKMCTLAAQGKWSKELEDK